MGKTKTWNWLDTFKGKKAGDGNKNWGFKCTVERKVWKVRADLEWVRMVKECLKFGYVDFDIV